MENTTNTFEEIKLTKASTNKVACNVYIDAFEINKVRIQNFDYGSKNNISCYIDFEDWLLLTQDASSGRLIKRLDEEGTITVTMGGSKTSKRPEIEGKPESRTLTLGKSGDTIFINMQVSEGEITGTGIIKPVGKPILKIGMPLKVDKFRSMFIYTGKCIEAYLSKIVKDKLKIAQESREEI